VNGNAMTGSKPAGGVTMGDDLSLDQWIRFVFGHPVADPAWHFDIDAPYHELSASRSAEHAHDVDALRKRESANRRSVSRG
jgi:hypothetical protein